MSGMPRSYKVLAATVTGAALAVLLTAVLVVALSGKVQLHDFPEWLEALSTFAAFTAAAIAIWSAMSAFNLEAKREARFQEDQHRAQASKVAGWAIKALIQDEARSHWAGGDVKLRNASDLPVSDVTVFLFRDEPNGDDRIMRFVGAEPVPLLPPGEEAMVVTVRGDRFRTEPGTVPTLRVVLSFRDSAGQMWQRDAVGDLRAGGPYFDARDGIPLPPAPPDL